MFLVGLSWVRWWSLWALTWRWNFGAVDGVKGQRVPLTVIPMEDLKVSRNSWGFPIGVRWYNFPMMVDFFVENDFYPLGKRHPPRWWGKFGSAKDLFWENHHWIIETHMMSRVWGDEKLPDSWRYRNKYTYFRMKPLPRISVTNRISLAVLGWDPYRRNLHLTLLLGRETTQFLPRVAIRKEASETTRAFFGNFGKSHVVSGRSRVVFDRIQKSW